MADEATINVSLNIKKISTDGKNVLLDFPGRSTFRSNVTGNKGPLPGSVLVPLAGVDVDLTAQLTTPGLCWLHHQGLADGTDPGTTPEIYYVEIGIKDVISGRFYPLLELWPGDAWPLRLTRNLLEAYNQTGTGTGAANNTLHLISHIAPCNLFIGAFEV